MLIRRLSLIAFATVFTASSSFAMLQAPRPALADRDDHKPRLHQRHDRDDHVRHNANGRWSNGQWIPNRHPNNGRHNGWKNKHHDRDHLKR